MEGEKENNSVAAPPPSTPKPTKKLSPDVFYSSPTDKLVSPSAKGLAGKRALPPYAALIPRFAVAGMLTALPFFAGISADGHSPTFSDLCSAMRPFSAHLPSLSDAR